jgi:hypothetical protein
MKVSTALMALCVVIMAGCAVPHGSIRSHHSSQLWAGMTRDDVIRVLGEPDHGVVMGEHEKLRYVLERPTQEDRPFEVKLLDGVVQSYEVLERDPAKVDRTVASFKQEVAVPWYSAEEYAKILTLLPPAERVDSIPPEEWAARTELSEHAIRSTGCVPVRVMVDATELESWCSDHSVPVDKSAITAFTAMKLGRERGRTKTTYPAKDADFLEERLTVFSANH